MNSPGFSIDPNFIIATAEGLEGAAAACSAEQAALRTRLVNSAETLRDCAKDIRDLRHRLILLAEFEE